MMKQSVQQRVCAHPTRVFAELSSNILNIFRIVWGLTIILQRLKLFLVASVRQRSRQIPNECRLSVHTSET